MRLLPGLSLFQARGARAFPGVRARLAARTWRDPLPRPSPAGLIAVLFGLLLSPAEAEPRRYGAPPPDIAAKLDRLKAAYPGKILAIDGNELRLADGSALAISDGRADKTFEELLNSPDVDDMFAFDYPAGAEAAQPPMEFDPGRVRVEALFRSLYGDCREKGVAGLLRTVKWVPAHGGGSVPFTTAQGADKALEAVSAELDKLPKSFSKYLLPSAGTYNCREIAGTTRMSNHAYGAAIDINVKHSAYWQWQKPGADGKYKWSNEIPAEIVAIFEKHGFIWGGRWYHFDTMHFEYRPEMLPPK